MRQLLRCAALFLASPGLIAASDGLVLPAGFHAQVVATGLTGIRHLAVRDNGDVYVSTRVAANSSDAGIWVLHLDAAHRLVSKQRFGDVTGGTGIRIDKGMLYASSPTAIYSFKLVDGEPVPGQQHTVVSGLPATAFLNRPIAFDGKGHLFVSVGGTGNICAGKPATGQGPVGQSPCPDLTGRSGVWRFRTDVLEQRFPQDGERLATGVRDLVALDVSPRGSLFGVMHGRNGTHETWPNLVGEADDAAIAEEMDEITKGSDLGWPYTYYDGVRHVRLTAPEYGGDGHTPAKGRYSAPAIAFPGHAAPLDLLFYTGHQFPKSYRGGAFVAFHGGSGPTMPAGHPGYNIAFVPFDRQGHAHGWVTFADGFAGPTPASRNVATATYRPVGLAAGRDGSLYVADSNKGQIWRITYAR